MKLSRLYNLIVKYGIQRDPRKRTGKNTFADTRVLYGAAGTEVKKILIGIDIDAGELLLADRIRAREGLDLVMAHHPEGKAHAAFYEVMQLQVDLLKGLGIPERVAQGFLDERMQEVARKVLSQNHMRAVDAARLLELPFICVHTPADNHVFFYLRQLLDKARPRRVKDIIDVLMKIPEYKDAAQNSAGPRIIAGSPQRPVGKISLEMTGGTEGPKDVLDKMYQAGVRTLVCMHLSEEHFKKVKDNNLNVVIAGHISSDTLGLNLLLDRLEKEEKFTVFSCSGFRRVRHNERPYSR
jgi:putative NIF3 family GTP cyclohydrolase 1 type 2